ncbi:MAG: hypothetical protein RR218_09720, partial [Gordonibacter sp.]
RFGHFQERFVFLIAHGPSSGLSASINKKYFKLLKEILVLLSFYQALPCSSIQIRDSTASQGRGLGSFAASFEEGPLWLG